MIAGFTELDIRGSVEGSRAIFLQAIRRNPDNPDFYLAMMEFEIRLKHKIDM